MRDVYVAGAGLTPFGRFRGVSAETLAMTAVRAALADAGAGRAEVDETFCGSSYGGPLIGQRVLRALGMTGGPVTNVENACSSGSTALREAVSAIRSERSDTVLVIGVDVLSRFGGGTLPLEASDNDVNHGVVMPAVYAMRARRYLADTGATRAELAAVSVKARANGARNPDAQLRKPVTAEEVLASRMVADPLTLFMSCPTGDGAAALVVTGDPELARRTGPAVRIAASVLQSGAYAPGPKQVDWSELTARTAGLAYEQAGLGPADLGVVEVHDAFAIAELMYYEALGLCGYGDGPRLLASGHTAVTGAQPVNPGGGLLSRGHPIGATGVAQVVEVTRQLRGTAGDHQVTNRPNVALTQCTGGGISGLDHGACTVHVLVA